MSDREIMLMDLRRHNGLDDYCDEQCRQRAIQEAKQVLSATPAPPVQAGGTVIYNITVVIGNSNPVVGDKAVELEREKFQRRGY